MSSPRTVPTVDFDLRDHALCNGLTELFFTEPPEKVVVRNGHEMRTRDPRDAGYRAAVAQCRRICAACPVRYQCLVEALEVVATDDRWGIRGGLTPAERDAVRRDWREHRHVRSMANLERTGAVAS